MIASADLLPDVIARFPATRAVFDAAGLHGCGGALGPRETVEFFARVHKVDLDTLLRDLEAAAHGGGANEYREELGDILYRRHFRAAIAILLGAGALLGTLALTLPVFGVSAGLFWMVQAHANAQVFGWIGLFVMGFAFQGLPRFKYVSLWRPRVANAAFLLMLAGVVLHLGVAAPGALWLGIVGGALQAVAAVLFAVVLGMTLRSSATRDVWDKYVIAAAGAFVAAAVLDPVLLWWVYLAPRPLPASVMAPFRDFQLFGFGVVMALGVGQRILPVAFGFREVSRAGSMASFVLVLAGIGVWVAVGPWGALPLAAGLLWMTWEFRGWTGGAAGRSTKFIRAAFVWLAVAAVLLAVEPWHTSVAFHSAVRHAVAIGFLSMLILGVSSKVVPILRGLDLDGLPALWTPFVLVTAGNVLRVAGQILDDVVPAMSRPAIAASAPLVYAGFAVWGAHLWSLLGRSAATEKPAGPPAEVDGQMHPADVVFWFPQTLDVFARFGFGMLRNPILRRTLGRTITLSGACAMKGVLLSDLLSALNEAIRPQPARFEV